MRVVGFGHGDAFLSRIPVHRRNPPSLRFPPQPLLPKVLILVTRGRRSLLAKSHLHQLLLPDDIRFQSSLLTALQPFGLRERRESVETSLNETHRETISQRSSTRAGSAANPYSHEDKHHGPGGSDGDPVRNCRAESIVSSLRVTCDAPRFESASWTGTETPGSRHAPRPLPPVFAARPRSKSLGRASLGCQSARAFPTPAAPVGPGGSSLRNNNRQGAGDIDADEADSWRSASTTPQCLSDERGRLSGWSMWFSLPARRRGRSSRCPTSRCFPEDRCRSTASWPTTRRFEDAASATLPRRRAPKSAGIASTRFRTMSRRRATSSALARGLSYPRHRRAH